MVTREQLLDAGLSPSAIRHRVSKGRLHRLHPGVFSVGRPAVTQHGRWLGAVLACGRGAALSHLDAAMLWRIWERRVPAQPHVSAPKRAGATGPRGIRLHRTATLGPNDITERDAIPVTTLRRTLLDLASILDDRQLKSAVRQAERLHRIDLTALRNHAQEHARAARLRRILEDYVPAAQTEGEPEADFLELCAGHDIPLPQTQVPIGPYRADFLWPDLGLVIEIDDRASHDTHISFRDDRARDRFMQAHGLEVQRFTTAELRHRPAALVAEIRAARTRRAARSNDE